MKKVDGDLLSGLQEIQRTVDKLINGLQTEWPGVFDMVKGTYKNLSLQDLFTRLPIKYRGTYQNMAKHDAVSLYMQVTSVECERIFSMQRRIK